MASTWTKAGKVRRSFKTGRQRQKDRQVTPITAIHETCILLDELRTAMYDAELNPDDVRAAIVIVTPPESKNKQGFMYVLQVPPSKQLPRLFATVEEIKNPVMVGLVFAQMDREMEARDPGKAVATWLHPFHVDAKAMELLHDARMKLGQEKTGKFAFN